MTKSDLRIVFMGTPEFAVETLRRLVESGFNVVAVVTQPDRPVGRHGSVLQPSAVKRYAQEQNIPVMQPEKMRDPDFIEALRACEANLQVVVAFRMLPEVVWAMPEYGTFNVHASLLPQYRGAAPINWAIINGERETGVTTFFLDHEIDTGRIIMQRREEIKPDDNVESLYDRLMVLGADAAIETIEKIIEADGHPQSMPQQESDELRPAPKIFKETCEIEWRKSATEVNDFVRGLSPIPGAWTTVTDDRGRESTLKIYRATVADGDGGGAKTISTEHRRMFVGCGDGRLEILELQLSGKRRMTASEFLNGNPSIQIK